ncbi:PREDICTED: four-jointed box protein 1 [Nanorana parkeri]|uniref:four-jointed box protein 1 n=1 Tax=Nanorana parkeri TaxID=125878 RepID=UPI0008547A64|nr:PREDICTED: four-jointed box protein 1 [Nanorana parkeri]
MRTALVLVTSGLLLVIGGVFWIRKDPHPVEQPGHPHPRPPRALRLPALAPQTPPVTEGHSSAQGLFPGHTNPENRSQPSFSLEQGIYWPRALERALPQGFTDEYSQRWQQFARTASVVALERGCGRSTNRLATLSDGSKACVRYGINPEQIQGEVLSFYLSRLLGLPAVPPCILSKVGSMQWAPVLAELGGTGWVAGSFVTMTPWLHNLSSVLPPLALRAEDGKLRPLLEELHSGYTGMVELAQWGDLIVFDYLTANFDRLVSNLFSLQWDARVMLRGTNNLHRSPDGTLVLLDNEAGLAHGYRVRDTWDKYNKELLATVCLFRRGMVRKLRELYLGQRTAEELHSLYLAGEPLAAELGLLTESEAQVLQDRVGLLYRHIQSCQDRYS